ncbi:hypothetical protein [Methylorubrum extorquens]|uniref:Uncharacterized protein n=1 Tax=Methylorubrum extorquens DSM 13060 TaxID=882800 RepID=H1KTZ3_METEX|nr:hypothetical protein [Methylorubrum extorquens]EHP83643.1 hypothetical protein MetexDRAFT_6106 [Methylorubrum extorquens DSM 13060]
MSRGARQMPKESLGKLPSEESRRKGGIKREQVVAVMALAQASGLTAGKDSRISGRVSSELIERAKARTGLESDTELVEFALANLAVEDNFAQVFRELHGTVDPGLDLEF